MTLIPVSPDLSVLNCGAGDMTFSFDENDPQECARASRVVQDMLKRGYMLFARTGKPGSKDEYSRVKKFDPKRKEYIIADGPEAAPGATADSPEPVVKRGRGRPRRLPAQGTPVTAVAPKAGG